MQLPDYEQRRVDALQAQLAAAAAAALPPQVGATSVFAPGEAAWRALTKGGGAAALLPLAPVATPPRCGTPPPCQARRMARALGAGRRPRVRWRPWWW